MLYFFSKILSVAMINCFFFCFFLWKLAAISGHVVSKQTLTLFYQKWNVLSFYSIYFEVKVGLRFKLNFRRLNF